MISSLIGASIIFQGRGWCIGRKSTTVQDTHKPSIYHRQVDHCAYRAHFFGGRGVGGTFVQGILTYGEVWLPIPKTKYVAISKTANVAISKTTCVARPKENKDVQGSEKHKLNQEQAVCTNVHLALEQERKGKKTRERKEKVYSRWKQSRSFPSLCIATELLLKDWVCGVWNRLEGPKESKMQSISSEHQKVTKF